ncbi:phage portal protein [Sinorhizobium meliloti]|uniref:phage portal protein n=1 Tax=Rhizobium meliloti TaxID=382 RepID=UPI000FDAD02D|nr:phage portal protein [Sinorhizobium meliloti]RVG25036.1 phage portal protein [Sinorhizobium meliloti]
MLAGLRNALGFGSEKKAQSIENILLEIRNAASGITVTPRNATEVPAVSCAVGIISEKSGDLPAKLYHRETRVAAKDHPAYRLIHDETSPFVSASQFRVDLTRDAQLWGNGYAYTIRSSDDRPLSLQRLEPWTVQNRTYDDGTPFYVVTTADGPVQYEYTDILHLQPFGNVAPIYSGRKAIALAMAFEGYLESLLANGGRPSSVIKAKKALEPEAKRKIVESWFRTHGGKNSGSTAILDEDMDVLELSMKLVDAQFIENRLEQIREISRAFRIPPTMLFELTRGTWSNTEEMSRQFYTLTLKPWLTAWTWAYSRVLLNPAERNEFYIEFITDDLLTTDFMKRATALGQYRSMGAFTGNEVRAMLNMPPHPDGDSLSNPHITTTTTGPAPTAPKEEA